MNTARRIANNALIMFPFAVLVAKDANHENIVLYCEVAAALVAFDMATTIIGNFLGAMMR